MYNCILECVCKGEEHEHCQRKKRDVKMGVKNIRDSSMQPWLDDQVEGYAHQLESKVSLL